MTIMTKELPETTINGHLYQGRYIPASEAVMIGYKLVGILSGSGEISALAASKNHSLVLDLLAHTTRDGSAIQAGNFDRIYTQNLGELMEALNFVIGENFSDFLLVKDTGKAENPSPELATTTTTA